MTLINPLHVLQHGCDTKRGHVRVVRHLGKGKSGYSFLADLEGQSVVLKTMHDESCPYYQFGDNKARLEVQAYDLLQRMTIRVLKLLTFDLNQQYLVKEYVDGPTAIEWLISKQLNTSVIAQLFRFARQLRKAALNIDYFPANFVIAHEQLYYVDDEVNPFAEQWSLAQWDMYYWADSEGLARFHRTGDAAAINVSVSTGEPIKEPFEAQVAAWITAYNGQATTGHSHSYG
jgi:tRNA A-37 threonylcarbamoyl transferase component Bud32